MRRSRAHSGTGFSLLELVVAFGFLAVGILTAFSVLCMGYSYVRYGQDDIVAMNFAVQQMEFFRANWMHVPPLTRDLASEGDLRSYDWENWYVTNDIVKDPGHTPGDDSTYPRQYIIPRRTTSILDVSQQDVRVSNTDESDREFFVRVVSVPVFENGVRLDSTKIRRVIVRVGTRIKSYADPDTGEIVEQNRFANVESIFQNPLRN